MKHTEILKRAWRTMLGYRALWFFGVILALTTVSGGIRGGGGGSGGGGGHNDYDYEPPRPIEVTPGENTTREWREAMEQGTADFNRRMEAFNQRFAHGIPEDIEGRIVTFAIVAAIVLLLLIIIGTIARYVSETSLIRMVDDHEETESQKSVRQGWRMGWSRAAWRMFLIDLLIDIPTGLAFLLLFAVAAAPLLLFTTGNIVAGIIGALTTGGFYFVLIILALIVSEALRLLKHFARRACALDEQGVGASIHQGYALARRHLKDIGLMWLITLAVRIAWPIAMLFAAFLLVIAGIMVGGIIALIIGGIATLMAEATTAWTIGGVTGGVIFVLVLMLPLIFIEGLREVFLSSTWTLTYRQLRAMEVVEPAPLPQAGPAAEQAAA